MQARHRYFNLGAFRVRLTVRDSRGQGAAAGVIAVVNRSLENVTPAARVTLSPLGPAGRGIDGSASWDGRAIVDGRWGFGQGGETPKTGVHHIPRGIEKVYSCPAGVDSVEKTHSHITILLRMTGEPLPSRHCVVLLNFCPVKCLGKILPEVSSDVLERKEKGRARVARPRTW